MISRERKRSYLSHRRLSRHRLVVKACLLFLVFLIIIETINLKFSGLNAFIKTHCNSNFFQNFRGTDFKMLYFILKNSRYLKQLNKLNIF